jgi:hypothetical protein
VSNHVRRRISTGARTLAPLRPARSPRAVSGAPRRCRHECPGCLMRASDAGSMRRRTDNVAVDAVRQPAMPGVVSVVDSADPSTSVSAVSPRASDADSAGFPGSTHGRIVSHPSERNWPAGSVARLHPERRMTRRRATRPRRLHPPAATQVSHPRSQPIDRQRNMPPPRCLTSVSPARKEIRLADRSPGWDSRHDAHRPQRRPSFRPA